MNREGDIFIKEFLERTLNSNFILFVLFEYTLVWLEIYPTKLEIYWTKYLRVD